MDPRASRDAEERETLRASSAIGRIAAVVALGVAAVAVALLLFGGGSSYEVTAEFQNASQLVRGSQVVVGGAPAGGVKSIALGPQGQALVTFTVDDAYAPLHRGTIAQVRSYSLSGIANRQIQLTLPPPSEAGPEIPSGGGLSQEETVSEVDLDQIFNTLNASTVRNFKHVIQGFEISYEGVGQQANRGIKYLNPFLSTSRRVFGELSLDTRAFERLIVDTSELSGALAARAPDLSLLIHNVDLALGAIGNQSRALSEAVRRLPGFMRQANTTFVNLRATLNDLDPLVEASKPVADRLGPFFHAFRGAARDAVPTIRDLSAIVRRPGPQNDLVELTRDQVPLARAGVGTGSPDCGANPTTDYALAADDNFTQGALGETVCSLRNGLPALAFFRPYTPELVGWFNDFSTSGIADANGGIGRISTNFNTFTFSTPGFPQIFSVPQTLAQQIGSGLTIGQRKRCPGAIERNPGDNSTPFTDNGTLNCDTSQVPTGP
jgi:phospholipid/cholesterol/gamma-HCH transport system substrate-binding protein